MESDATDLNTRLINSSGAFVVQTSNDGQNIHTTRVKIDHSTGDISFYEATGTTPKFFWDASAEVLGLGTSTPNVFANTGMHIHDGTTSRLHMTNGTTGSASTDGWEMQAFEDDFYILGRETAGDIIMYPGNSEAMRIDASGNVMVGKTNGPNYNAVGVDLTAAGEGQFTVSGGATLQLNRQSTDGDIAVFRKDGTTVGSIRSGGNAIQIGTANTGLYFSDNIDSISPYDILGGTVRDNAIDLGYSGGRFKDGHFSGTVTATDFVGDGSALTGVGGSTSYDAVGSYSLMYWAGAGSRAPGTTVAGSSLYPASTYTYNGQSPDYRGAGRPSGTWRMMGNTGYYNGIAYSRIDFNSSLFVRIS
tara:strand:- start:68 stop:1150 length:1083 start_codon:yes stop_codon:yes gene_type:complete